MKTVAIIGGGFCGTLAAVNLVRLSPGTLHVVVVNSGRPPGRGAAYGTARPEHLLNVVARNMSAFPDVPSHFVDWLRNRADFADIPVAELREQFVPRRVYGDYLQDLLFWHAQPLGGGHQQIEAVDREAIDVVPVGRGARVVLDQGDAIEAQCVLLATGNAPPAGFTAPAEVEKHPAYCPNPWRGWYDKPIDSREDVLLVGTGLTMIDVFLTLRALGHAGTIYALSRNGLLPMPHFKGADYPNFPPEAPWTLGLGGLAALVEEHCERLRAAGMNPALVVDKLRPFTQRIWRTFTLEEKREFGRRHRTRWNVFRHRIPPSVAALVESAQKDGRLRVLKGAIGDLKVDGSRLRATMQTHGDAPAQQLVVGLLVNCTGPRESFAAAPEPLFRNLLQRGLIRPDELDMGIEVTPDFAVVGRDGRPSDVLFAIGPLLKGTLWETTAVPELRAQTHQLAQNLLAGDRSRLKDWAQETPADLVEYYI